MRFGGPVYAQGLTLAPQITGLVDSNTFNTATNGYYATLVCSAYGADSITLTNNIVTGWKRLFCTANVAQADYPMINFWCRLVIVEDNQFNAGLEIPIYLQWPLTSQGELRVGRNTLSRGANWYHLLLGGTNAVKVSGQIKKTILYEVVDPNPVPNPLVNYITYKGTDYRPSEQFVGEEGFPYFTVHGAGQVRLASPAPWSYIVKIGSGANANTYLPPDPLNPWNNFEYFDPPSNSIKRDSAAPPASADGVSTLTY